MKSPMRPIATPRAIAGAKASQAQPALPIARLAM
jgi:hypothetical protein